MMNHNWRRGLFGLVAGQSLGAFSDTAWKFAAIMLVTGGSKVQGPQSAHFIGAMTVAFLLPYILVSPISGWICDRVGKRSILVGLKMFDVLVFLGAVHALKVGTEGAYLLIMSLVACSHAFSGPAKYGILPQLVPEEKLSTANGVLQLTTMMAVILGSIAAGMGVMHFRERPAVIAWGLACASGAGALVGLLIPPLPAISKSPASQALRDMAGHFRTIFTSRVLRLIVAGICFFWFVGILFQTNAVPYGDDLMQLSEVRTSLLLAAVAIGIGMGSLAAGFLSGGKIELGLVPLGSIGMTVFCVTLYWAWHSYAWTLANFFALGFAGGFFIVPLTAMFQLEAPPDAKGGLVAAMNVLSFGGMLVASFLFQGLAGSLGRGPQEVFLVAGIATLGATIYIVSLLPESMARLVLWLITRSVYKVTVVGRENVPERGGALLVCNHVSYVDGFLVLASLSRFVRFVLFKAFAQMRLISWLGRMMRVIPIDAHGGPKALLRSLEVASEALQKGELVCIFAEGEISRTGQMGPFRSGMERILKHAPGVPIIPVHLDGVWGSVFSRSGGKFFFKLPRAIPYPVTVSFGKPLPAETSPSAVRQAIQELGTEAFVRRSSKCVSLGEQFVRASRRLRFRFAAGDLSDKKLTFGQLLTKAVFVARAMRPKWDGQERVGIVLPPSMGGLVANCAALLAGRTPVNLNFTASEESMRSAAKQCGLTSILTSRAFLEKFKVPEVAPFVYLEDVAAAGTPDTKLAAALAASLLPARSLMKWCGMERLPRHDDVAAIIFSSGSTGEPKGVQLTHFNITSNLQSLLQIYKIDPADRIMGILPFFHAFGFLATLALPACVGVGVIYHANPLDAPAIGQLCRRYGGTFLLATPTFLQSFTRRCEPGDLGSLRYVVVGAEKLTERVAAAFRERFGIDPLEGYGCTECSPLVSVNGPDFRSRGFHQIGHKRGTIGQPAPGISIRIVNPESGAPVPFGEEGLMLVKGPNVMKGYLGKPEETAKVLQDGWYRTGDMAKLDEDGFITITDRLSRFSKIGGEMVPHIKIEEALHHAIGAKEQVLMVTSLPDEKKGERLIVLHTLKEPKPLIEKLNTLGLPNLWLPREDHFFLIEALPLLGSGKADLRKARDLARWHLAKSGVA